MRALRLILASSTLLVVGCQVVGGFEDFSATGGPAAGGSAGSGGVGGDLGAGGAAGDPGPAGAGGASCPPLPTDNKDGLESATRPDGSCFLIMKRPVDVGAFYAAAKDVPDPASVGGPCGALYSETFACMSTAKPGCKALPVSCVTNPEAEAYCKGRGPEGRLCSLEELRQQCGIKQNDLREWAFRCVPNDGGGLDCDTHGDLPAIPPKAPPFSCDVSAQTRSDDRRPDLGFRCCVGPKPEVPLLPLRVLRQLVSPSGRAPPGTPRS